MIHSSCLILSTYSTDLHSNIQKDIDTGVFFKFLNARDRDREWISLKYALERNIENPNDFLKNIDGEGLLFRDDVPHSFEYFIPFILEPVKGVTQVKKSSFSSPPPVKLSNEAFAILMYILQLIRDLPNERKEIIRYLRELKFDNIKSNLNQLHGLPLFILSKNGTKLFYTISQQGIDYYEHYIKQIKQLPMPFDSKQVSISTMMTNLRERLDEIDQIDREKNQQLITDILEFAGSLLTTYFQSQGMIDWRIFRIFLDLTQITGYDFTCYKKRINFLEALFSQIMLK
jgi:hypothetical protein